MTGVPESTVVPIGVGRLGSVVLDCPEPRLLADFYGALLGWRLVRDEEDWAEVRPPSGPGLAFQLAPDHVAPTWPDTTVPQQVHLDVEVGDVEAAEAAVLALGATSTGIPDPAEHPGTTFRVYRDPAGHPFCLCW